MVNLGTFKLTIYRNLLLSLHKYKNSQLLMIECTAQPYVGFSSSCSHRFSVCLSQVGCLFKTIEWLCICENIRIRIYVSHTYFREFMCVALTNMQLMCTLLLLPRQQLCQRSKYVYAVHTHIKYTCIYILYIYLCVYVTRLCKSVHKLRTES